MTITIRPATLGDLTTLRLMWQALVDEQSRAHLRLGEGDTLRWTSEMAMRLEKQAAGDPAVYVHLATDEIDVALGFLSAWVEDRAIGEPHRYWVGDHLYVTPPARGTGVGRTLLAHGFAYIEAHGLTTMECVAVAGDDQWARRGWTPILVRYSTTVSQARVRYASLPPKENP
jgi:GNAT superfamily N-acetyltransferase